MIKHNKGYIEGGINMLDVMKEILQYKPIDMKCEIGFDNEISNILIEFSKTYERTGKDQYKSLKRIDEILEILDESSQNEAIYKDIEEKSEIIREDRDKLLKSVIEIADLFEDIYVYSCKSSNQSLYEQMKLQWSNLNQSILKSKITRFGETGDAFDIQLHIAKEAREEPQLKYLQILEVVKSGYIYKGELIRKADVIINKTT